MRRLGLALVALLALAGCGRIAVNVALQHERDARSLRVERDVDAARDRAAREQWREGVHAARLVDDSARLAAAICGAAVDDATLAALRAHRERSTQRETYFSCLARSAGARGDFEAATCLVDLAHGRLHGGGEMCGADFAPGAAVTVTCGDEPPDEWPEPLLARSAVRESPECVRARAAGLR